MTSFDQLIPSLKDYFPGKPLTTDNGDAFILDQQDNGSFVIQYTQGKREKETVNVSAFHEERDKDEILYDQKDL